ncbi:uncharacterized protein LOC105421529 [Amborella trichopoda]|uniref:uncharacterized protein LOC105421529 n=1 Tax=Amborella trichopoda TaxID=13333 RepID=UPI0005D36127|nr:uncharacterized protein LOC105421529 [Amborella trichopoda]|eukprot:XP_011627545.1 uncharacterized protein LOC105421529 [Amborella trichopoda]
MDNAMEWLVDDDEVEEHERLIWDMIIDASGTLVDPLRATRSSAQSTRVEEEADSEKTEEDNQYGIEEVGEDLVIQVVTNNAARNLVEGHLLQHKKPCIFWTPFATHCIDLMLEAIGELTTIKGVLSKAKDVTVFMYSHTLTFSMMHKFTKKRELVRPALNLVACHLLRQKRPHIFWTPYIAHCINLIFEAIGFIYDTLERAKKENVENLGNDEAKYSPILEIIDIKWDRQLRRPLHAMGYYLNPKFCYADAYIEAKATIMDGFNEFLEKLVPNPHIQDKISIEELISYKCALMSFGKRYGTKTEKQG